MLLLQKNLVLRNNLKYEQFDEVIIGNVAQPANSANIAKSNGYKSWFPKSTPAIQFIETVLQVCSQSQVQLKKSTQIKVIYT